LSGPDITHTLPVPGGENHDTPTGLLERDLPADGAPSGGLVPP